MNSRRLMIVFYRTVVFFVLAVVVSAVYGWPWFGIAAIALTGAAAALQLGGALWLRRTQQEQPAESAPRVGRDFLN
ncbi:hypothetical protein GCM10025787_34970 [Saccharopolyspora rosea]